MFYVIEFYVIERAFVMASSLDNTSKKDSDNGLSSIEENDLRNSVANVPTGQRLFVITGPSGVGKGTLCKMLLANNQISGLEKLQWSVSATTRQTRSGEQDGVDYFFLTKEKFQQQIDAGEMLEWATYNNQFYGTPQQGVQAALNNGQDVLLEIEVQGALSVRQQFKNACLIFILPPDEKTLRDRLTKRDTNTQEEIDQRMAIALKEIEQGQHSDLFNYKITNETLPYTFNQIVSVVQNWPNTCAETCAKPPIN